MNNRCTICGQYYLGSKPQQREGHARSSASTADGRRQRTGTAPDVERLSQLGLTKKQTVALAATSMVVPFIGIPLVLILRRHHKRRGRTTSLTRIVPTMQAAADFSRPHTERQLAFIPVVRESRRDMDDSGPRITID